jgi:hypothetical protein
MQDWKVASARFLFITLWRAGLQGARAHAFQAFGALGPQFAQRAADDFLVGAIEQRQRVAVGVLVNPVDDLAGRIALGFEHDGHLGRMFEHCAVALLARAPQAFVRLQRAVALGFEQGAGQLELAVESLELGAALVELHQQRDLAAQDLRHQRHRDVIDGADLVALELVDLADLESGHEDDRRVLETRMLPDQARGFEAVHVRHHHVEQDHGEGLLQQPVERFLAAGGAHSSGRRPRRGWIRRSAAARADRPPAIRTAKPSPARARPRDLPSDSFYYRPRSRARRISGRQGR